MKIIGPASWKASITRLQKNRNRVRLVYEEVFSPMPAAIERKCRDNTLQLLSQLNPQGMRTTVFRRRGCLGFRVRGTLPLAAAADMMVGEFLHFSRIGRVRLGRIMSTLLAAKASER